MIIDTLTIQNCSPSVSLVTMKAIVKTESNFNSLVINLNTKGKRLQYQAKNMQQAINWVNYLEKNGYNFDVGLAQVNIKNIHKLGYWARDLLEPCLNLQIASKILTQNYKNVKGSSINQSGALYKAISAYNTGNYHSGFTNGYVMKVVHNAQIIQK